MLFDHRVQGPLHLLLVDRIKRACRLVEQQNCRLPDYRARDCNALLLPARELHSLVPDVRLELVRKPIHKFFRVCLLHRVPNSLERGVIGHPVANVLTNALGEQHVVLRNNPNVSPQMPGVIILKRPAIQHDAPGAQFVIPLQEPDTCRLSTPSLANKRDLLPWRRRETQPKENLLLPLGRIRETHVLELDFSAEPLRLQLLLFGRRAALDPGC
mmetsp:Transcript_18181/g.36731  ORF Transcript_18181/g.36731 Transcript_18181/m.36731 type:complete len:214 (-) Transcript_18181:1358-1999(-)